MASRSHAYHFLTHWRVRGTVEEVANVLADPTDLPRWWPSVYLDVEQLSPGDENGIGGVVELFSKGWLPYTVRWRFGVTEADPPHSIALEASGDFVGEGRWTFIQDGPDVAITYDWRVEAQKPMLRRLSFLLKPIFAANHHWAMARGEESLDLELRRRRAKTDAERDALGSPPGPTFRW